MSKSKQQSQLAMFDVPATKHEYNESKSAKKKDEERAATVDVSSLGLNAVFEGKSKAFKSFDEYINNLKKHY